MADFVLTEIFISVAYGKQTKDAPHKSMVKAQASHLTFLLTYEIRLSDVSCWSKQKNVLTIKKLSETSPQCYNYFYATIPPLWSFEEMKLKIINRALSLGP